MGVFLLLPSLLSSVISHQGTPSLWIPSSLRQFHSPLSVSVTQSSFPSQSKFSSRLETYIIFYCTGLVGPVDCYLWSRKMTSLLSLPPTTLHDFVCGVTLSLSSQTHCPHYAYTHKHRLLQGDLQAPDQTYMCTVESNKWLSINELLGAMNRHGCCQSRVSKEPRMAAQAVI